MIDPEKLIALSDDDVRQVLRVVETKTVVTVLGAAPPDVAARVMAALANRAAQFLKDEIELQGRVSADEARAAQRAFGRDLDQAAAEDRLPARLALGLRADQSPGRR
ncbi:MAG: hypothetical protein HZC25_11325 [Rhodospirillales bacterium]|nr:hypothetical protein [Rhodospirillales bacterium]